MPELPSSAPHDPVTAPPAQDNSRSTQTEVDYEVWGDLYREKNVDESSRLIAFVEQLLNDLKEANDKLKEQSHAHQTQLRQAQDELESVKADKAKLQKAHDKLLQKAHYRLQQSAKNCQTEPDNTPNTPNKPTAANAGQAEMQGEHEELKQTVSDRPTELTNEDFNAEHTGAVQGEHDALKEEVQRLRDELTTANDMLSAKNQAQNIQNRRTATEEKEIAASNLVSDLQWCRAELLGFLLVALRIFPDAAHIDDLANHRPDQIVWRTLCQLEACRTAVGRIESRNEEILDAHKAAIVYLREAKVATLSLRAKLDESSSIIEVLRDEKVMLVHRANRLQQTVIRMDEQIKRLTGLVTQYMEMCSALEKSRDGLPSRLAMGDQVLD